MLRAPAIESFQIPNGCLVSCFDRLSVGSESDVIQFKESDGMSGTMI